MGPASEVRGGKFRRMEEIYGGTYRTGVQWRGHVGMGRRKQVRFGGSVDV
jgi:hypothetical protein